jgi:tRNA pseudouridine38-40 synthase
MQRYAFEIQYNGTDYVGWQKQPNGKSIQEEIELAFNKLYNLESISIIGCGRTDAGVHANHYIFHVDLPEKFSEETLLFKLNRILSFNICISNIFLVKSDFHARFDATERVYRYFINHNKSPFNQEFSWYFPSTLQVQKMNQACEILLGRQDFTSFSKLHTDVKTNICTINFARWVQIDEHSCYFEISADRFLRNMVRAIVGTLIEVGLEKIDISEVQNIIAQKDRGAAKHSVPAKGLFLWKICYEGII